MREAVPSHPQNAGDLEPPEGELSAFTGPLVSCVWFVSLIDPVILEMLSRFCFPFHQDHLWLNSRQAPWPCAWSQASTASEIALFLASCGFFGVQAIASGCKWVQAIASECKWLQVCWNRLRFINHQVMEACLQALCTGHVRIWEIDHDSTWVTFATIW